ncbi:MAG: polysaccharide pyruvyl transferase family protein [Clostridiales bacterium]|nr:polysaccharide pyruvyl transferase family protein [Clostridiales bacterium]MBR3248006.1 polysaccharide pyruvyl transferase family protein [Clostridiales bacterium]
MQDKSKHSVFLYGAWKRNLGDDLFLKAITNRYPDCTFHVMADREYMNSYSDIDNLVIHLKNGLITKALNLVYRKLNHPDYIFVKMSKLADTVVYLGGSLYQQESNWRKVFKRRMKINSLFKNRFAVGNNFGPFTEQEFYDSYKLFFKELTDVCFRDKQSRSYFPYDNVRSASDIIFGVDSYCPENKGKSLSFQKNKPYAVVSVINLNYNSVSRKFEKVTLEIYETWIARLITKLEQRGYSVVLMGFCTSEGDDEAIDRIINNNKFNNTSKFIHNDIDESLSVLRNSDLVIATRFHSMILGWAFERNVVPIVYGNKMRQVIVDAGFDGCCVDIEDIDQYDPDYVIDQAKKLDNISFFKEDSSRHFEGLDSLLADS